jgi:DNA-binding SARP family transcriptional activator
LLLSLIYSFMGMNSQAHEAAVEGTRRGDALRSPFVTAVGHMRQGHALNLIAEDESSGRAVREFEKTLELSQELDVPRLSVEANWGLCRAYGYSGDLQRAQIHAQQAIGIAVEAGDEWIASLTRLTLGASLMLAARYEAAESWLNRAVRGFEECSDSLGRSAARLWLAFGWLKQKQIDRLARILPETLNTCQKSSYHFLFTRPSLLGPPDERLFVPLLLHARQNEWDRSYADRLLDELGLKDITVHPGFRLRVQTLGGFHVWRGRDGIPSNGWRRESARQLFQLFLTYRHAPLDRDQICEYLWPDAELEVAQRNFKIALNTLYQVLEPEREPGSESAFVFRDGTTYTLRPNADLWLDAEEFSRLVREAGTSHADLLQKAIDLYRGDYLPEALYETWVAEEREHLVSLFLESADRLAALFLSQGNPGGAIDLAQRILAKDACWERAYRYLMLAYDQLGDRGQAARVYRRCVQTLHRELDVSPSSETQELYKTLTS